MNSPTLGTGTCRLSNGAMFSDARGQSYRALGRPVGALAPDAGAPIQRYGAAAPAGESPGSKSGHRGQRRPKLGKNTAITGRRRAWPPACDEPRIARVGTAASPPWLNEVRWRYSCAARPRRTVQTTGFCVRLNSIKLIRVQVLRRTHQLPAAGPAGGRGRPQRLRQVQHHGRRALGAGRVARQRAARRVHAGRDLQRHHHAASRPRARRSNWCSTTPTTAPAASGPSSPRSPSSAC